MKVTLSLSLLLPTLITAAVLPHFKRTPPGIPTLATAKKELAALTVQAAGSQDGYSRSEFKTWDTIEGTCNTREYVLKRDGTDVVVDSACESTSGTWVSPYDGATWTAASDLDIDHFVPLSNAWKVYHAHWRCACLKLIQYSLELLPGPMISARLLPTMLPTHSFGLSPTTSMSLRVIPAQKIGSHLSVSLLF